MNTIKNYLNKMEVQIDKNTILETGERAPQGSVIDPILLNILCDEIIKIDVPDGTTLMCYADDLGMVITAPTKEQLMSKGNVTLNKVKLWTTINKLQIAKEKTKAIILNSKRKTKDILRI